MRSLTICVCDKGDECGGRPSGRRASGRGRIAGGALIAGVVAEALVGYGRAIGSIASLTARSGLWEAT